MTAPHDPIATLKRAHVFDPTPPRATHVSDPAIALATAPTLRYTLAGFPSGNLLVARRRVRAGSSIDEPASVYLACAEQPVHDGERKTCLIAAEEWRKKVSAMGARDSVVKRNVADQATDRLAKAMASDPTCPTNHLDGGSS